MARIRTIKPEFWTDSIMVQLPHLARLLYIAIWSVADDFGYFLDEPDRLAMQVMPREDAAEVEDLLELLIAAERIERYQRDDGTTYLRVAKWTEHQRVDKPTKSRIAREDSRKLAIPQEARRAVAVKYGCQPGGSCQANCYYCGSAGKISWTRLRDGRPSYWVYFPGLELDHVTPESDGGKGVTENLVLACRRCNRSKATDDFLTFLQRPSRALANVRETSRTERELEGKGSISSCQGVGTTPSQDGAGTESVPSGGYTAEFEEFWSAYPNRHGRKRGKEVTFKLWRQVPAPQRGQLLTATANYSASQEVRDGFAKDPERFLKRNWWQDWITPVSCSRLMNEEDDAAWNPY